MQNKVKITWIKGYYAKFRVLKIYTDKNIIGEIKQSESKDFILPENAKYLYGK